MPPEIREKIEADRRHQAALRAEMAPHVLAALDAADIAPDSATGRHALASAPDAAYLVRRFGWSRRPVDLGLAAVDVVIASIRETARGVRTVGANTDSH